MKKRIIRTGLITFIILFTYRFLVQPFKTIGISMEPLIPERKIIFVNKLIYKFKKPERGDIIVFRTSDKPYVYFVKRIIALENEEVEIKNGIVFINGEKLKEDYVFYRESWNLNKFKVKPGHVFVIGDNRGMPEEFHLFAQLSVKNIIGKVIGYR